MAAVSVATTSIALSVAFGLFIARQWRVEREALVERGAVLATVMAANASPALLLKDGETARGILTSSRGIPDARAAYIFDAEGRLFAHDGEGVAVAVRGSQGPAWSFNRHSLTLHVPVRADQERVGELVLVSGLGGLHRTFLAYAMFAGLLFAGVLGPALWAALWLAKRVIEPVERLSAAMVDVRRSGEFAQVAVRARDSEIARLADEFNALLGELAARETSLRETMESLIAARDQADAASQLKSEFLANMSHEIRTPLNGVLGMAAVMAGDDLAPAQKERLEIIQRSGSSLLAILNDILDVAKVEAGELKLDVSAFDVCDAVREACSPFMILADAKGVTFDISLSAAVEGSWLGDPARLRQIIVNLASNAVKFTEVGRVGVEVRLDPSERVVITVSDTGVGVPADKLPTLFDKFIQADASTTRKFGGTGLGLSIALELTKLMGGELEVESRVGVGSTFRLVLPLVRGAHADPLPSPLPGAAGVLDPGLRVLAAEDNPTNRLVLRALLQEISAELEIVEDGEAALAAWERGDFDVILMDVRMPVLDGVSATKRIREAELGRGRRRTPIIALTANVMSHQVDDYLAVGMDASLAKPISPGALFDALDAVLPTKSGFRAAA